MNNIKGQRIEGYYLDGCYPLATDANIAFGEETAALTSGTIISKKYPINEIRVSPRIDRTDRFISFSDGSQFTCPDNEILDCLCQESPTEGMVSWLEERWQVALACVFIICLALTIGYFVGLPYAAKHIAIKISMDTGKILGEQALTHMDEHSWLFPSAIEKSRQEEIRDRYFQLIQDLPDRIYYQLEFRQSHFFGPNALAFPGGIIVITDQMVAAAKTDEEIMAVLAHETGHIELRHSMRSLLQNSVVGVTVASLTSDATTISGALAGIPMLLAQTKYSRKFESDADEYAFELLNKKGYSSLAFASIMDRLFTEKKLTETGTITWLSTHPVTSERIKRARESAHK